MFNDVWVRLYAQGVIKTRYAPEEQAAALEELAGMSSAELAGFAHQYLGTWQEHVHETYCLSALAAKHGEAEVAGNLAAIAAASERAASVVRGFLTDSLPANELE